MFLNVCINMVSKVGYSPASLLRYRGSVETPSQARKMCKSRLAGVLKGFYFIFLCLGTPL